MGIYGLMAYNSSGTAVVSKYDPATKAWLSANPVNVGGGLWRITGLAVVGTGDPV